MEEGLNTTIKDPFGGWTKTPNTLRILFFRGGTEYLGSFGSYNPRILFEDRLNTRIEDSFGGWTKNPEDLFGGWTKHPEDSFGGWTKDFVEGRLTKHTGDYLGGWTKHPQDGPRILKKENGPNNPCMLGLNTIIIFRVETYSEQIF